MKITQQVPPREYPYLAVMIFEDPVKEGKMYPADEIYIISKAPKDGDDTGSYVQPLNGGKAGWFTKEEREYTPLPKGYQITLTQ